jgi:hypothetical protein
MTVFKEYYEITGAAGIKLARAHAAKQQAACDAHWKLVKEFKADGYRPSHEGRVKTLLFTPQLDAKLPRVVPPGMRYVGKDVVDGKIRLEYVPSRNTKSGSELAKKFAEVDRIESWSSFADAFGKFEGRSPIGEGSGSRTGFVIYHCHGIHVRKPRERFFLVYPRELKDKWRPPKGVKLVRESDMLRAIEDYNAAAKKKARK